MKTTKILFATVSAVALVCGGVGVAAYAAGGSSKPAPVTADFNTAPDFASAVKAPRAAKAKAPDVVPSGAQFKMRSGRSGHKYVACNEQRTFNGQAELHCLSFSPTRGWGKSLRWVPRYQLFALTAELPADPAAVAIR